MDNTEYFNTLGSLITNDVICKQKLKPALLCNSSIQLKKPFHQQTGLTFCEKTNETLHLELGHLGK
jgi:hypothetical protein